MLAAQTSIAIAVIERDLVGDRRRLILAARADVVETLKAQAPEAWRDPPACFTQAVGRELFEIVGSFDGAPLGVFHDRECPPGVGIYFDGVAIGGVLDAENSTTGHARSYHEANGATVEHPAAYEASAIDNHVARATARAYLTQLANALADAFRNQPLCVEALVLKLAAERLASLGEPGREYLQAILAQTEAESLDMPTALEAAYARQRAIWPAVAAADLALRARSDQTQAQDQPPPVAH